MTGGLFGPRAGAWAVLAAVAVGGAMAVLMPDRAAVVLGAMVALVACLLLIGREGRPVPTGEPSALALSEADFSQQISALDLAAAMPDPLIVFEGSSAVVYANEPARRAFGLMQDGMSLLLKFRAPEMQTLIAQLTVGLAGHKTVEHTERFPVEATYRVTGGAIGANGRLFFLLFKDQSEARRIDRMRADFIANASHELRTPLASISGFLETLRGPAKNDTAARERFLSIMQDQTARMSRLIDDLLSLSRLETKPHGRPSGSVNLRQLVEAVIDALVPLANDLQVIVERNFPDEPLIVQGDRDELFQVFENLVENACKYGQAGGRVAITIDAAAGQPPEAVVSVRDFGPGIAEEHIPRITERFYRVDVQSSRAQKGTGLGLAIVKHILTRHGARLNIQSILGQGSTFVVHLPLK